MVNEPVWLEQSESGEEQQKMRSEKGSNTEGLEGLEQRIDMIHLHFLRIMTLTVMYKTT